MKRIVTLLLALCLMTGFAFAETAEVPMVKNWSDYADTEVSGDFVEFPELGLKIFIPEILQPMQLNESYYASFAREDLSCGVLVIVEDNAQNYTLDTMASVYKIGGYNPQYVLVNGISGVSFTVEEELGYFVTLSGDKVVSIVCTPANDEEFIELFNLIFASIQTI